MSESASKIMQAFEKSPHRWRPARAIAAATGIPIAEVIRILERSPDIIRARKGNNRGEALFARRDKTHVDHTADSQDVLGRTDAFRALRYLVLLPFEPSSQRLRDTIGRVIREEASEPEFLDKIAPGARWVDAVAAMIRTSDVVIADLTRQNPNVLFELGIAHGLGKPLVLLLRDDSQSNLPSDLAGYQHISYTEDNLTPFATRLQRTVQRLASRRGEL